MIPITVEDSITLTGGATAGESSKQITNGNWCKVYAHCQISSGSCTWATGVKGDIVPDAVRVGSMVVMGPITLRPGESAVVSILGAPANATADIKYRGYQGDATDGSDLSTVLDTPETDGAIQGNISLGPVSISGNVPVQNASGTQLAVTQGPAVGGVVTIPARGGSNSATFTIPPGANAINAIAFGHNATDTISYQIISLQSGTEIIDVSNQIAINENEKWSALGFTDVNGNLDTEIEINVTAPGTNIAQVTVSITFLAAGQVTVSEIINTPGNPVYVNLAQPASAWSARNEPGSGSVGPTVTHTPPANQSSYVTYATGGLLQQGTTAFVSFCRLSGTVNGVNQNVWEGPLGVQGVLGDSAQCPPFSGGAIKFDVGTPVTLGLSGTIATGVIGMLSMLGYDQ